MEMNRGTGKWRESQDLRQTARNPYSRLISVAPMMDDFAKQIVAKEIAEIEAII